MKKKKKKTRLIRNLFGNTEPEIIIPLPKGIKSLGELLREFRIKNSAIG